MVASDPAERLLPSQAPADRHKLVVVAMFALCVALGGVAVAGSPSWLLFQMIILISNLTVFILGLLAIYFFIPSSTGIPGLPISAHKLVSVTLAASVATLFLNSTCLLLVAG